MKLKPFFTYEQQLEALKIKGIIIDEDNSLSFLESVNYYRLSAFLLPFKGHYDGIPFSRIKKIYEFDSKLRSIIFPVIENIEINLRAKISYYFSSKYGVEGYLDDRNFSNRHNHEVFKSHLERCIRENKSSKIVAHHEAKYDGHYPFWVIIEFFSLGMLSYFYSDLLREDKKAIAKILGCISDCKMESWLRCLTDLRNRCAHYSRLYYWNFTSIPLLFKEEKIDFPRTLYPQLLMLKHMVGESRIWRYQFMPQLSLLIQEYSSFIELVHLGIPEGWAMKLM